MVKVLYKIFLGTMLVLFIGFGISVFKPGPTMPKYPTELEGIKSEVPTPEQEKINSDYAKKQRTYQDESAAYSRTVSVYVFAFSILLLILSLTVLIKVEIIGDGVLLGGLLTLGYGIIRALMSENNKFQFIAVTIGLVIALFLGWWEFLREKRAS